MILVDAKETVSWNLPGVKVNSWNFDSFPSKLTSFLEFLTKLLFYSPNRDDFCFVVVGVAIEDSPSVIAISDTGESVVVSW